MEWLWPIAFDPVLFGEVIIKMGGFGPKGRSS